MSSHGIKTYDTNHKLPYMDSSIQLSSDEVRRNLERPEGMRAYWENVVNEAAREGVNMYATPAAPRERGAGVSRFLNSESSIPSSSSGTSISNHPEDWHVNIDGVWIYNPALARARHARAASLFNEALPQTSPLAQMVKTTINDRPPTTINDRPPTTINDRPPTTIDDKPPVEPPQTTEAMPTFGYDNSMDVNHWLEQTRDYIIWQLRLSKFHYFRLNRPRTNKMSKKELIYYLFQKREIKRNGWLGSEKIYGHKIK
jgi:hypothetical protein